MESYYGIFRGMVVDADDPERRNRYRVYVYGLDSTFPLTTTRKTPEDLPDEIAFPGGTGEFPDQDSYAGIAALIGPQRWAYGLTLEPLRYTARELWGLRGGESVARAKYEPDEQEKFPLDYAEYFAAGLVWAEVSTHAAWSSGLSPTYAVGDLVWLAFENGDRACPVIIGAPCVNRYGISLLPPEQVGCRVKVTGGHYDPPGEPVTRDPGGQQTIIGGGGGDPERGEEPLYQSINPLDDTDFRATRHKTFLIDRIGNALELSEDDSECWARLHSGPVRLSLHKYEQSAYLTAGNLIWLQAQAVTAIGDVVGMHGVMSAMLTATGQNWSPSNEGVGLPQAGVVSQGDALIHGKRYVFVGGCLSTNTLAGDDPANDNPLTSPGAQHHARMRTEGVFVNGRVVSVGNTDLSPVNMGLTPPFPRLSPEKTIMPGLPPEIRSNANSPAFDYGYAGAIPLSTAHQQRQQTEYVMIGSREWIQLATNELFVVPESPEKAPLFSIDDTTHVKMNVLGRIYFTHGLTGYCLYLHCVAWGTGGPTYDWGYGNAPFGLAAEYTNWDDESKTGEGTLCLWGNTVKLWGEDVYLRSRIMQIDLFPNPYPRSPNSWPPGGDPRRTFNPGSLFFGVGTGPEVGQVAQGDGHWTYQLVFDSEYFTYSRNSDTGVIFITLACADLETRCGCCGGGGGGGQGECSNGLDLCPQEQVTVVIEGIPAQIPDGEGGWWDNPFAVFNGTHVLSFRGPPPFENPCNFQAQEYCAWVKEFCEPLGGAKLALHKVWDGPPYEFRLMWGTNETGNNYDAWMARISHDEGCPPSQADMELMEENLGATSVRIVG